MFMRIAFPGEIHRFGVKGMLLHVESRTNFHFLTSCDQKPSRLSKYPPLFTDTEVNNC